MLPSSAAEFLLFGGSACNAWAMHTYHRARVQSADIDDLGHMNVRVYARHAAAAMHALLADAGLDADALDRLGARVLQPDCHTRFRREQHLDAPIAVRGGVLSAQPECIRAYLELYNMNSGDLAATFCKEACLVAAGDLAPIAFPEAVVAGAHTLLTERPAHGEPRSLPQDSVRRDLTTADMAAHNIEARFEGYEVTPALSTSDGWMDLAGAPWLAFADTPPKREANHEEAEEGWFSHDNVSIATLEARHLLVDVPCAGEVVQTYTAIADVGRKIMRFRHWSFDGASGRLLAVLDEVGIGLDLVARRACDFPPAMRQELLARSHPELI
ncbi:MAG: hypothetical protein CMQ49_01415 [Gammaproteobacteria bacterium]|nr:hypothetical protein [Gammaproteobacteria bacterium]